MAELGKQGECGTITNIQRLCTHDGPGSRTTVFLKGCPLRCVWCHNPETQNVYPETGWNRKKCIHCQECLKTCTVNALIITEDGMIRKDNRSCIHCGKCTEACPAKAMVLYGRQIGPTELAKELIKDKELFQITGGGVTFSGGEPLLWPEFVVKTALELKKEGIHTALDTCLHAPLDSLKQVLPYINIVLADIKIFDGRRHKNATGLSNELILKNLKFLAEYIRENKETKLYIRTPLIPGYTMDAENIEAIDGFIHRELENVMEMWEMVFFHNMCAAKYKELGRDWELADAALIKDDELEEVERRCMELKTTRDKIKIAGLTAKDSFHIQ